MLLRLFRQMASLFCGKLNAQGGRWKEKDNLMKSSPEKLDPENIRFGIAVSNLANDINPALEVPKYLNELFHRLAQHQLGAELQFEGNLREILSSLPEIKIRPFSLGVHAPTKINLLDVVQQEESFNKILLALELADKLKAGYFVYHLQTHDYWNLDKRSDYIRESIKFLNRILHHYRQRNYRTEIYVENLEFPKYPAIRAEISQVCSLIHSHPDIPMGIALDIGHLWHSGYLIHENLARPHMAPYLSEIRDEWSQSERENDYSAYLSRTIRAIGNDLRLFHLTGCKGNKTHLLPDLQEERNGPPSLSISKALEVVYRAGAKLKKPPEIINESIGYSYETVIKNCHTMFKHMIDTYGKRTE